VEYGCRCCNPTTQRAHQDFRHLAGQQQQASEQPGEEIIACMNIHVLEEAKLGWIYTKSWISIQLSFAFMYIMKRYDLDFFTVMGYRNL
jgi:hypothetical protein